MKHEHVEYIPEDLQPGMLYISKRYATASHLCCCGCLQTVVTPLNPAKWRLTERGGKVSLSPSIGNWSFACQSHYWIEGDRVRWAGPMSRPQILAVQLRDRRDAEQPMAEPTPSWLWNVKKSIELAGAKIPRLLRKLMGK